MDSEASSTTISTLRATLDLSFRGRRGQSNPYMDTDLPKGGVYEPHSVTVGVMALWKGSFPKCGAIVPVHHRPYRLPHERFCAT